MDDNSKYFSEGVEIGNSFLLEFQKKSRAFRERDDNPTYITVGLIAGSRPIVPPHKDFTSRPVIVFCGHNDSSQSDLIYSALQEDRAKSDAISRLACDLRDFSKRHPIDVVLPSRINIEKMAKE